MLKRREKYICNRSGGGKVYLLMFRRWKNIFVNIEKMENYISERLNWLKNYL